VNIDNLYYLYEAAVKNPKSEQINSDINKNNDDYNYTEKINDEARNIINDAYIKASLIQEEALSNAKKEAETAKKDGHQKGYEEGYVKGCEEGNKKGYIQGCEEGNRKGYEDGYAAGCEEGKRQALKENTTVIDELLKLLHGLEEQKLAIYNSENSEARSFALSVARKVIDEKLTSDDIIFLNIYKKAVQELIATEQKTAKLIISDHEYSFVTSNMDYLLSLSKGLKHIEVVVSKDAAEGTCIIETDTSIIDASVDTQFKILLKALSDETVKI
jgi:flagellar assembly protein FliH